MIIHKVAKWQKRLENITGLKTKLEFQFKFGQQNHTEREREKEREREIKPVPETLSSMPTKRRSLLKTVALTEVL